MSVSYPVTTGFFSRETAWAALDGFGYRNRVDLGKIGFWFLKARKFIRGCIQYKCRSFRATKPKQQQCGDEMTFSYSVCTSGDLFTNGIYRM